MNIRRQVYDYGPPSKLADVAAVALLGWVIKVFIARSVAVNGDTGLYLFDAQQILMGRIQFLEYPSRSPLFEHALAAVIWLGDAPLHSARAFMVAVSVALGIAVYVFTKQLASHRAGLTAMGLFYLTPFTLIWGSWVKTEQAAALTTVLAFVVALHVIDREQIPGWAIAAVGTLFAFSYLIRRVALVHIGAFALFVVWYRYRQNRDLISTVAPAVGVVATALAVIGAAYLALARGSITGAVQIADAHTLALFRSMGQGALGWVERPPTRAVQAATSSNTVLWLCRKCGANTAHIFATTAMVTLPAFAGLLVFARSGLRRLDPNVSDIAVPAIVIIPAAWKLWDSWHTLNTLQSVSLVMLAVAVAVVWFTQPVEFEDVWTPKLALPVVVCLALAAGYLYRDRILYTSYFQDFFPFVATIAGIVMLSWFRTNNKRLVRVLFAVLLITAAITAGAHSDPFNPTRNGIQDHWFTTGVVDQYGEDIDSRVGEGEAVFTAQPLYVIHSDATPLADLSRRYYLFRGWPDSDKTAELESRIIAAISAGAAPYAINDTNMHEMTEESPQLRETLRTEYCEVDAPLYQKTGGQLLAHKSTGECA